MSLLPEIIFDILLRLPVKPLLRFRCLSKVMFCTIDDSDFIKAHLNRSIETNTHKKLILVSRRQTFPVLCTLDFDDGMKERVKLDDPLNHSHRWWAYRVLGCCNGLILLYVDIIKKLILWNPFTKRHKILKAHANESLRRYDGFGLGYDAASNDYRIVVVPYKMPKEVWIYSLRCNSWKKVDVAYCKNLVDLEINWKEEKISSEAALEEAAQPLQLQSKLKEEIKKKVQASGRAAFEGGRRFEATKREF
ncbi:hypothetical protein JCGZ_02921 [Jatropha curcas]|uniref:F-box domain-containing protein n=1 Tax=Jatropha curcas TaxID=180498 RepID=A0A067L157_JATCU|nr:hypothetical protein JCGZ_02921 [Jatropha curcas]